jgi:hypothetical protein
VRVERKGARVRTRQLTLPGRRPVGPTS